MSNVIKASTINYSQEVKNLDLNAKAEEITSKYFNEFYSSNIAPQQQISFDDVARKLEEEKVLTSEDVEFTPGIFGEQVNAETDEESYENEAASLEARLSEKRALLAEIEKNIEDAGKERDEIIAAAQEEAEQIKEEARNAAQEEAEQIRQEARAQGYDEGLEQSREQVESVRAEAEAKKEEYRAEYEKQVEELEPAFVELIVKYVRKLTNIYNEDKNEIILHLIDDALKGQKATENFIIRVSEQDYPIVAYSKEVIKGYISEDSSLEIVADKMLTKSQCMIETDSRIYDCSLDEQLNSLIEDIRLLAEKD